MRIAVIGDTSAPTPTQGGHGLGHAVWRIAEGLKARGHEVTLYAVKGSTFSGERVLIDDIGQEHEPKLAALAYRDHQDKAYDVFYCHSHRHDLARLFPKLPVVNHYHDQWQPVYRCAIVCSTAQQRTMGLAGARVIHHELDPREFVPSWRHDGYLVYLGVLREYKQPLLAIEVAARVGMPLKMAGQTPHKPEWLFSGNENVDYLGPLDWRNRNELLRGAAALLQFGHSESFGLTSVEAGFCGTPVVAMPSGGSLDIVEEGCNGVFVQIGHGPILDPAAQAVYEALTLSRKTVRDYTAERFGNPERQIRQIEDALQDCAAGRWW